MSPASSTSPASADSSGAKASPASPPPPAPAAAAAAAAASTTAIVDDAYALTGTTHLWRRGLSFDSPFAATIFDEALTPGRPADLVGFRRRLLAGRLGS
ncbi:MAG: hypothetical protein JNK56_21450, partial [Myxococcales bacterium]|nr:hypothetical protein [Myxococcales bacterium]